MDYWKSYYNYKLITGLEKSKSCSAKQLFFYEKSYCKATFDGLKGVFDEVDIDHSSKVTQTRGSKECHVLCMVSVHLFVRARQYAPLYEITQIPQFLHTRSIQ